MRLSIQDIQAAIAIYEYRNLHKAADSLHITQAALKKRLAKVIDELGPLFAHNGTVFGDPAQPLPNTKELICNFRTTIQQLKRHITQFHNTPITATNAVIRLGIFSTGEATIFPQLDRTVRAEAPNIQLKSVGLSRNPSKDRHQNLEFAYQQLHRGEVDTTVYFEILTADRNYKNPHLMPPPTLNSRFYVEELYTTDIVLLSEENLPIPAPDAICWEALEEYKFLALEREIVQGVTGRRRIECEAQTADTLAVILSENSNYIAFSCRPYAEQLSKYYPLKITELPERMGVYSMRILLAWTNRTHEDNVHKWVRDKIIELYKK